MLQFSLLLPRLGTEVLLQAPAPKEHTTPQQPQPLRCVQCGGELKGHEQKVNGIPLHAGCARLHCWLNQ